MCRQIEWIKKVVRLCMKQFETDEEKRECFAAMENEYRQFTDAEKRTIRDIMMTQFEVNDMIYVMSVMVQYMEIEDFYEDIMENILRGDFDGYVGSMLQYQTLVWVKGQYRKKRMLYKNNMTKFGKMLERDYPYLPLETRNRERIAIITGQLLDILHSPTRVILNMVYTLQKYLGYEVMLFVCPCNMIISTELWYNQWIETSKNQFANIPIEGMYRNEIFHGYQIDMDERSLKEYSMMLSLIHAWNPMFVIDADTTNAVAGLIGSFTTLVSLPMSTECPISEGNILVRSGKKDDETEKEYIDMLGDHQRQLFMKETFPAFVEESQAHYTRSELGLPEDKFLIAVVGNRLFIDLNQEFIQVMQRVIKRIPDAVFVMIGKENGIREYFEDSIFDGHLFYLGYCEDLMGVYQVLDLYMNPKRAGGGFSSAIALQAELPVITLPDNDVAYNCGDKFIVQDYEEMIDTVCRYASDQEFYEQQKKYAWKYKEENGDEKLLRYMKELLDGVTKIMEEQER